MKCIKQFRYYGKNNPDNYPSDVTYQNLTLDNIFKGYGTITQMGIQAPRGTVMYLNNETTYPIVIGETGIYEIDLQNYGQIYSIRFTSESLDDYDLGKDRLLVDIIYEGSGV